MSKRKNKVRKNRQNFNTKGDKRAAEAVERALAAADQDNDFAMVANLAYLGDKSVDWEKTSFEEWLTEEKKQELLEITARVQALNARVEQIKKELEAEGYEEWEEDETEEENEAALYAEIAELFDLTMESDCKKLLEMCEETKGLERCPRCGEDLIHPMKSRNAKISICRKCWNDERRRAQQRRADRLTDWQFIQHLQEGIDKCA